MADARALLDAILDHPRDDAPRVAYAGWLDERDDPRAAFIRHQLEISAIRREGGSARRWGLAHAKAEALLARGQFLWRTPLEPWLDARTIASPMFFRGFVELITVDGHRWAADAAALCRAAPILHLTLAGGPAGIRALAGSPSLARIVSLDCSRQHLDDAALLALVESPHLGHLAWLDASHNQLGRPALDALAARLPHLDYINWSGNPSGDPVDEVGSEGGEIVDTTPSVLGQELEARWGPLRWLHTAARWPHAYPPYRDAYD